MATIKKAYADDFEKIYPLMQEFNNPLLKEQDWRRLFDNRWRMEDNTFGVYIEDEGKAMGFLGTIFSRRKINGKDYRFCNLSTWVVKEEYRGMSLMLLFEVMKQKDLVITNFTANRVAKILRKFGFKDLAKSLHILLPIPALPAFGSRIKVYADVETISKRLSGEALTVFNDHVNLKCNHMLIESGNENCHIIYDVIKKKRLPVARIHHISDLVFFNRFSHQFALPACRKARVFGMLLAENLLRGVKPHFALTVPQRQASVYRSDSLTAYEIDTIYSELQVLGLRS